MNGVTYQIEPLSFETFAKLRTLIYETTNINMRDSKHILVSNRLRKRVVALNLASYDDYYRYLTDERTGREELPHFIDAVSTNETYFYREANHLVVMRDTIFPEVFARKRRAVVWSAGCSTGEEPYTLRILYEEGLGKSWDGELRIIATDINTEVVEQAKQGTYRDRSVRFVPADILSKYFEADRDGGFTISQRIRSGIDFRVHNLLKQPAPAEGIDVIFCRNVMIYFDKSTQRRLSDDYFARALDRQGYLCIGHSESLSGTSSKFQFIRGMRAPVYRLRETGVPT